MKIAVWHNLPSGGGSRALFDHVRGLINRGHTVEVWCPPTANRDFAPLGTLVKEHVVPLALPVASTLTEKLQLRLKVHRELAAMEEHCARCASEIDKGGFDVVFVNTCMFFRMSPIARFTTLPSILYLQEPYRWLFEALPRLKWVAKAHTGAASLRPSRLRSTFLDWKDIRNSRLQARHEVENAASFTQILVNSYFSRESVIRAYGRDADVCYLGIDSNHFTDHGRTHGGDVVGLGSITPEKNIRLVIEALALIPDQRPRLVWMGNMALPDYHDEMIALAADLNVKLDIKVGSLADEVVDTLNQAMVMVYAPRLEPFGLAPLEANACGVPVVAVHEGGVRETIEDGVNGLLVPRRAAEIAKAVIRIRDEPDLANRLRRDGRRRVEMAWSLDAATDRLEHHLQSVI